jgi:hypothetical protein
VDPVADAVRIANLGASHQRRRCICAIRKPEIGPKATKRYAARTALETRKERRLAAFGTTVVGCKSTDALRCADLVQTLSRERYTSARR